MFSTEDEIAKKNTHIAFMWKCLCHKYSLLFRIKNVFHNNPWSNLFNMLQNHQKRTRFL